MKKINFENAEIINPAKVTIEGIDYEVTPAQLTVIEEYLSAETLNEMQSNIEESCVIVSPTEPTTNEKVWVQKGKNLINPNRLMYNINYNENTNQFEHTDNWILTDYIPIESNEYYIFSHSLATNNGAIDLFDKNKNYLGKINSETIQSPFQITNVNAKYIIIKIFSPNISNETWMQLEQGSTATEYEAYVEKTIHTKNNNGVYEEIANLESKYKLLWKNNNPNSAFEGGDTTGAIPNVTLLNSDYDFLLWLYKRDVDTDFVASTITPKGYGGSMGYVNTYGTQNNAYREVVRIDDNNFIVSHGYKGDIYHNDDNIIPIFVYGIKF